MKIEQVLDGCLEEIRSGGASIQDCLARYPQFADELGPLLRLAVRLDQASGVRPSREFKAQLRRRIEAMAQEPPRGRPSLRALLKSLLRMELI